MNEFCQVRGQGVKGFNARTMHHSIILTFYLDLVLSRIIYVYINIFKLFMVTGGSGIGSILDSTEIFTHGTWITVSTAKLPTPITHVLNSVVTIANRVFLFGMNSSIFFSENEL